MVSRIGILPAAGRAERFGGVYKELLPVGQGATLLSRSVDCLLNCGGCDMVVVVTSGVKAAAHIHALQHEPRVMYVRQAAEGMWGAMVSAMMLPAREYLFAMPDTYTELSQLSRYDGEPFAMWTFETDRPDRFGVLRDGMVVDKRPGSTPATAWGALAWDKEVRDFWLACRLPDYTAAINKAIDQFGVATGELAYYYDMASYADYEEWMRHGKI